jgi:hypothetical protein
MASASLAVGSPSGGFCASAVAHATNESATTIAFIDNPPLLSTSRPMYVLLE